MPEDDVTAAPLAPRIAAQRRRALARGTLEPIETRGETVTDGGIAFVVRTVSSLARKESAARRASAADTDPFRPPYEPDLWLGRVPPDHVALLNKFPVLDDHLLVVTRTWRAQDAPLDARDCEALLRVLARFDALAFYNAGRVAGASQAHRHLQFVPRPRPLPVADALDPDAGRAPGLPFPHAAAPLPAPSLDDPAAGAEALHALQQRLLAAASPAEHDDGLPGAWNLLATRELVWVVPRSRERCGPVGVNALGFAGLLLAADDEQAAFIRAHGPVAVLADVAGR